MAHGFRELAHVLWLCCLGPVAAQFLVAGAVAEVVCLPTAAGKQWEKGDCGLKIHFQDSLPCDLTSVHHAPPSEGSTEPKSTGGLVTMHLIYRLWGTFKTQTPASPVAFIFKHFHQSYLNTGISPVRSKLRVSRRCSSTTCQGWFVLSLRGSLWDVCVCVRCDFSKCENVCVHRMVSVGVAR